MIDLLVFVLIFIIIIYAVVLAVNAIPLPQNIKTIVFLIIGLVFLVILLKRLGIGVPGIGL